MEALNEDNYRAMIRQNALYAREHIAILEQYLREFRNNNFNNISNFSKVSREVETHLENIKVFVEKEEFRLLHSFEEWLHDLFKTHILEQLGTSHRKKVVDLFESTVKHFMDDLKREYVNERRLESHRKPRTGSFFKQLQSAQSLDTRTVIDEKRFDQLLHKTHDISGDMVEHAQLISRGTKDSHYEEKFVHEVKKFCMLMQKEFDLLLDEELNTEIQEADIIRQIDNVISSHPIHRHDLEDGRKVLLNLIKKDIIVSKQLFDMSKSVRMYLKKVA